MHCRVVKAPLALHSCAIIGFEFEILVSDEGKREMFRSRITSPLSLWNTSFGVASSHPPAEARSTERALLGLPSF